jgi:NAD(P)-dependent dehydrogenase (short-subunit alcohol dehydrogenase family)
VNSEAVAFLETSDNEFERVMNVNLRGVWNCMKGELRQMVAQGSGALVNCSSIGGLKRSRRRSAYSASKHAVIGLTRSAALDYAAKGIRINAVCPGQHAAGSLHHEELRSGAYGALGIRFLIGRRCAHRKRHDCRGLWGDNEA